MFTMKKLFFTFKWIFIKQSLNRDYVQRIWNEFGEFLIAMGWNLRILEFSQKQWY